MLTGVCDCNGLSIPAATRHIHHAVASQPCHQGGNDVVLRVAMSQTTVVSTAPSVELPGGGDCSAVGASHSDLHHVVFLGQLAHQGWLISCSKEKKTKRCSIKRCQMSVLTGKYTVI